MEKDHLNDKVLDKEKALSVIKTSYLNSYKKESGGTNFHRSALMDFMSLQPFVAL